MAGKGAPGASLRPRPGGSFEAALLAAGEDPSRHALQLPEGGDLATPWLPLVEGSLGLGLGTELLARFAPTFSWDPVLGDASASGVTLLHGLDRVLGLDETSVAVRLSGSLQRVRAGGYLEALATSAGVVTGVRLPNVQLYLHGRAEDARWRVRQRVSNPDGNPALPAHGSLVETHHQEAAGLRLGLGMALRLSPVALDVEMTPGQGGSLAVRLAMVRSAAPDR